MRCALARVAGGVLGAVLAAGQTVGDAAHHRDATGVRQRHALGAARAREAPDHGQRLAADGQRAPAEWERLRST